MESNLLGAPPRPSWPCHTPGSLGKAPLGIPKAQSGVLGRLLWESPEPTAMENGLPSASPAFSSQLLRGGGEYREDEAPWKGGRNKEKDVAFRCCPDGKPHWPRPCAVSSTCLGPLFSSQSYGGVRITLPLTEDI